MRPTGRQLDTPELEEMISNFRSYGLNMTYVNLVFPTGWFNTWNSLPNWVVSAYTTDTFKARLDKFSHSQDIVYDFRAQLHGLTKKCRDAGTDARRGQLSPCICPGV